MLPPGQIATTPAEPRGSSRLLVLRREPEARTDARFADLGDHLRSGDLLVVNETRVLRARLAARLVRTGRAVEIVLAHPEGDDWLALLGPARRIHPGDVLVVDAAGDSDSAAESNAPEAAAGSVDPEVDANSVDPEVDANSVDPEVDANSVDLDAIVASAAQPAVVDEASFVVLGRTEGPLFRLRAQGDVTGIMERWGHLPLPPYLGRPDGPEDRAWYQTVYARKPGAVAAPTAGLHFTAEHLAALAARGIRTTGVVLHVGPGTFLPVRAARAAEHRVLPERYEISAQSAAAILATRAAGGRVVAVGTTVARTLETWVRSGETGAAEGWTDLTVLPGDVIHGFDALLTNFHLPRSSLLLLVAAFAGRETILRAYAHAVASGYRFYSYGDAMLVV